MSAPSVRSSLIALALLALLATACSSSAEFTVTADESTPEATETDDTAAEATSDPVPTPTAEEATAEPTEAPDAEPTATPDDEADLEAEAQAAAQSLFDLDSEIDLPPDEETCIVRELLASREALEIALGADDGDFDALSTADKGVILDLAASCLSGQTIATLFVAGLTEEADADGVSLDLEDESACLAKALDDVDARRTLFSFALEIDAGDTSIDVQPLAALLTQCFGGELLGAAISSELESDPLFGGAGADVFSAECFDALDPAAVEGFWIAALEAGASDSFNEPEGPEDLAALAPLLSCMNFGVLLREAFAADGLDISDATAECLDREIRAAGIFESIIAGEEPDEATIGIAILDCLSPEELEGLGG